MARGFRMGGAGGGGPEPTPKNTYLYKDGHAVSLDNRGSYTWSSASDTNAVIPAQLLSDKIYCPATSGKLYLFGTTDAVDLTSYKAIHVVCKSLTGTSPDIRCAGTTTKSSVDTHGSFAYRINQSTYDYIDVSYDITNYNSSLYLCIYTTGYGQGFEITEWYLEPKSEIELA